MLLAGLAALAGLLLVAQQAPAYGREHVAPLVLTDTPAPPPASTATPVPPTAPTATPGGSEPSDPPGPIPRSPDVWVLLDGCLSCVSPDGFIEYYVHVGNNGTMEGYNVTAYNVLGPGLELVSVDMPLGNFVQLDGRTFNFQVGTVNPGQVVTYKIRVKLTDPNAATWSVLARTDTSTPGDPMPNNAHSLHGVRGGAWGPGPAPATASASAVVVIGDPAQGMAVATATAAKPKLLPKTGGEFRRPVIRRRAVNRAPPRPVVVRRRK